MAKIDVNKMTKLSKERNSVQEEVVATYTVFERDGEKYFQIDTYGRSGRVETEKASQILQMDEDSAKALINLLKHEFSMPQ